MDPYLPRSKNGFMSEDIYLVKWLRGSFNEKYVYLHSLDIKIIVIY
jgi:hypothetical protein